MASFKNIILQYVLSILRSSEFTSASPGHINTFKGLASGTGDIGTDDELRAAILEIIGDDIDTDSPDSLSQDILDSENKKQKKGINEKTTTKLVSQGVGTINDPASIVATGIQYLPHAALVALAIALLPMVFDEMTRPGGVLDLRWKRYISEEINAFLSRQTQKDTEMGVRQIIIQSKKGFTASNGMNSYNTQAGLREGGLNKEKIERFGMKDHSKGLLD